MKARFALVALPLALAACDAQAMKDIRMPWDKPEPAPVVAPVVPAKPSIPEPTGASPVVQPLEVDGNRAKVATADAETLAVTDLTAAGEGWAATVTGSKARFERPGAKPATVTVRRLPYSGGVEYIGTLNDQPFSLRVNSTDCGAQPMSAALRANGATYTGCAAPASAPAAAATADAATPKTKPAT